MASGGGPARVLAPVLAILAGACGAVPAKPDRPVELAGAWRAKVSFDDGALAPLANLTFLYSFNAGGTMTESSNYDGAPPVPPAYGVWRKVGPRRFDATYEFFISKPPASIGEIATVGWTPGGRGVLRERITLADDGQSYRSTIAYSVFDETGRPASGGGAGRAVGTRLAF